MRVNTRGWAMPPLREPGAHPEAEFPQYAGAYRLEACLGSGGMGVVHLARSASGMQLAVKVVHAPYAADPEFRARFRQEVAAARRVSGAFTAPVVDADPEADRPWMATLYVPGPTLAEQVKRNGPMAPAALRRLTAGLAEALRDIHRAGVIHRDLKPSNVLLTDGGPKVIDFGISRPYDSDLRTETGKLIGSPPYMAPEQFQRPREVGPPADVFALGAVIVHAATGRGPFDSDSPYIVAYQVVHDQPDLGGVPEELAPLVARCLAKDPAERPTPDEVMAALAPPSYEAEAFVPAQRRRAVVAAAVPAVPDGARDGSEEDTHVRAAPPVRRRWLPRARLVVAAAVLLLVAGAGAGAYAYGAAAGAGAVRRRALPDRKRASRRPGVPSLPGVPSCGAPGAPRPSVPEPGAGARCTARWPGPGRSGSIRRTGGWSGRPGPPRTGACMPRSSRVRSCWPAARTGGCARSTR